MGAVVVAGVLVSVGASHTAAAGDPLQVYASSESGLKGPLVRRFNLTDLVAGNAIATNQRGAPQPVGPVAVTADGSEMVFGATVTSTSGSTTTTTPVLGVEGVATGAVTDTATTLGNVVGIAVDPANPSIVYALESGGIERFDVGVSPPTSISLPVQFDTPPVSAIAISPDGKTLYVGEDDDGTGGVQSFSAANPTVTTFWSGRNSNLRLDSVTDVAMAPNGSALYVSGPVNSANVSSEVLALSLQPFSGSEGPSWEELLPSGGSQLASVNSLTVSPNGQTVFAGGTETPNANQAAGSAVQAFAASSGALGASNNSISIIDQNNGGGLASIAMSPDGQHLLAYGQNVANGGDSDNVVALNSSNLQQVGNTTIANSARAVPKAPQSIAITPAQVPLSSSFSVNVAQAGQPTGFSANPPSAGVPGISYSYSWNFGDGSPAASGQTVNHTFATPNTYAVTLTVRGRSPSGSNVDTPGQTPFWRALPATSTQNVSIPLTPPPTTGPHSTTTKPGAKKFHPKLAVNPTVGPPGTIVTVTGKGFPPNKAITIHWSVSTGSIVVTTDPHGNLGPTQLPILIPDVLGSRFAVASSTPAAKAAFLVVPGTAEPGGSQGIYLFRSDGP